MSGTLSCSGTYWDLTAHLNKRPDSPAVRFDATLTQLGGKRIATGRDFDESTGRVTEGADVLLLDQATAEALRARLTGADWRVSSVEAKRVMRRPYPPFTTSTLQQEAGRKLRLGAQETMRIAQSLYENGYITYHRTDSENLSDEAIAGARRRIEAQYGPDYLSPKPRQFKTRAKNAQEAHEAIRPAGGEMQPVANLPLTGAEASLYDLIWKRAIATQMADAELELMTVLVAAADAIFRASGRRVVFPGFFRAYVEGSDDPEAAIEDKDAPLPALAEGEPLDLRQLDAAGHETKPPARLTEAALVKTLEANGVGRPSTYATILGTIQDRGYVRKAGGVLIPTFTAFAVTGLLESDFERLVDVGFTAEMEEDLDRIAAGEVDWQKYLERFYLGEAGLETQVERATENVDARRASTVQLGDVAVRIGRYGPFIERETDGERHTAAVPDDLAPADLTAAIAAELVSRGSADPESLGADPVSGEDIFLKDGPYGPYVQRGQDGTGKEKPARSSLPKTLPPEEVTLEKALALLALPRGLGPHPESGKEVKAGLGRFGPYVVHDGVYASLAKDDDILAVELPRAIELLAAKANRGPRGRGAGANGEVGGAATNTRPVLKDLGAHPTDGSPVVILDGRYGPYISHGKTNASLPRGVEPGTMTMDQALALLTAKEGVASPVRRSRTPAATKTKAKAAPRKTPTSRK